MEANMRRDCLLLLVALLLTLTGCRPPERPIRNLIVLGSRSMVPLIRELATRFEEQHPDVRINIEPGSGARAILDTRQGLADIGLLGRSLRPEETGVQEHVLALDGMAFIVHRSNPVMLLQETHLVGVLTRVYTSWKDVGGSDRPILVVGAGQGRAIHDILLDHFALRSAQLRPDPTLSTSLQVLQTVAQQPAAIGYVSLGAAETFEGKAQIRLLPFQEIPATLENVRHRAYPLVRSLTLLTRETPSGLVKEFLDFATSEQAHDLIGKYGYVPNIP